MVEELGMADMFVKHLLWEPDVKICAIDGGAENELNDDETDSDESDDDEPIVDKEIGSKEVGKEQSEPDCVTQSHETCTEDAAVLANDLENISKHDLLHSSMSEKVKMTCESYKRLSSWGMPMYERVKRKVRNKIKSPLIHLFKCK